MPRVLTSVLIWLLIVMAVGNTPRVVAHQKSGNDTGSAESMDEANRGYFTDAEVFTQEGERLRFYTDLIKDRIVLINFFYTNCPIAPLSMARLFKLQKMLGDELGRNVLLLSISVDPERDSVEAVKKYAHTFNPRKGWVFITGAPKDMNVINRKLGNTLRLPEGHLQLFLMGNLKTGHWIKIPPRQPLLDLSSRGCAAWMAVVGDELMRW